MSSLLHLLEAVDRVAIRRAKSVDKLLACAEKWASPPADGEGRPPSGSLPGYMRPTEASARRKSDAAVPERTVLRRLSAGVPNPPAPVAAARAGLSRQLPSQVVHPCRPRCVWCQLAQLWFSLWQLQLSSAAVQLAGPEASRKRVSLMSCSGPLRVDVGDG